MWDVADDDVRETIMPANPENVIIITERTVALRLDEDKAAKRVDHLKEGP